jgi:predicted phage tail component-like protein
MTEPYFIFKNINSLDYGIVIDEDWLPPIEKAEDDIEYIEVPGRDGVLTVNNGRKKPIYKTIHCVLNNHEYKDIVKKWLTGEGELIISNEPDVFYKSRVYGPVQFEYSFVATSEFEINFICQPWAYLLTGKNKIIINSQDTIINNPGEIAKPLIKIYGNGPVDLILNNKIHKFYDIDEYAIVDSELMEAYKDTSFIRYYGDFPELQPGENIISWTGNVTKIEITPRWRR